MLVTKHTLLVCPRIRGWDFLGVIVYWTRSNTTLAGTLNTLRLFVLRFIWY